MSVQRSRHAPVAGHGEGAVAIPAIGIDVASGPEQPVPVASLTKLMTAYVVLHDHPLGAERSRPSITVTQADVEDYDNDTVDDDSNAQVTLGRAAHRAAGAGRPAGALGGQLRRPARPLGRRQHPRVRGKDERGRGPARHATRPTSPTQRGQPASVSTAADILKVAAPDMANPDVASIVKMPRSRCRVAGTISTYTPLLGLQGVIGVKSGYTTAAGGCDVVAVVRTVHGQPVLLLAAVTGQTGPEVLAQAGLHGLALVNAVGPFIGTTAGAARRRRRRARERGRADRRRHGGGVGVHADVARASRATACLPAPSTHLTDQARRGAPRRAPSWSRSAPSG